MGGVSATATRGEATGMRRAEQLLLGLAAALALATALRLPAAWESGNALNHVSGAWMTLADDLAHGTFYRPLHEPGLGYGGTRFFPLAFALHAALLRAGAPLLAGGYALSLAAGALAVLGAFALLRGLGLPRLAALAFAALALGGFAGQHGLSAVRGDLLPVALSALGLAAVASGPGRGRLLGAALLFGLAFAAKPTALTAPAAAAVWLCLRRGPRPAAALALATAALAGAVVLATDGLSGGRFTSIVRACAMGGAGFGDALRAPVRLATHFALGDPAGLVLLVCALAPVLAAGGALAGSARAARAAPPLLLPALWLAGAGGGALVVFASPGTGVNHLVEIEVAAAVALGAAAFTPGLPARLARLGAPAAAAAAIALALATWRGDLAASRLFEVRAVVRTLPAGPILSEDPLIPLAAGARPVLLDAWMLRLAAANDPSFVRGLAEEIARGAYAAVILYRDLDDPSADAWFADRNLGLALVGEIRRSYRRAGGIGRYHLYVPRGSGERSREPRVTAAGDPSLVVPGAPPR